MLELSDKIKEHFRNPQNVGEIENPEGMGAINAPSAVAAQLSHSQDDDRTKRN